MSPGGIYYLGFNRKNKQTPKLNLFKQQSKEYQAVRDIFIDIKRNLNGIKSKFKHTDQIDILRQLDRIIPNEYFGNCAKNRRCFYRKIIKRILTQAQHEYVLKEQLIDCFNNNNNTIFDLNETDLINIQIYLLDTIIKPLICYYYKPIKILNSNEVRFIKRNKWQEFQQKNCQELLDLKHLKIVKPESTSRTTIDESRGKLLIQPKNAGGYRPIILFRKRTKQQRLHYQQLIKKIYKIVNDTFDTTCTSSLYQNWLNFTQNTGDNREIYGIKLDIKDAFGNIDIDLLITIINHNYNEILTDNEKVFIINYIKNQYVEFGKKRQLYKWEHGLLQGDPLSGPLCELYMTYIDNKHLKEFFNNNKNFLHRTVDDYFFCTTDQQLIDKFYEIATNLYKINNNKTIRDTNQIVYYGKLFDLETKQVYKYYNFNNNYQIRYRFKLFNRNNPMTNYQTFLKYSMQYSFNNNNFTKLELNTTYNNECTVLINIFNGMLLLAFKFDAIHTIIRDYPNYDIDFIYKILLIIIKKFTCKIYNSIQTNRGVFHQNNLTLKLLNCLALRAFCLVFKKRSIVYKQILKRLFVPKFIDFGNIVNIDTAYFNKLPNMFQNVSMSRSCNL